MSILRLLRRQKEEIIRNKKKSTNKFLMKARKEFKEGKTVDWKETRKKLNKMRKEQGRNHENSLS